MQDWPGRTGMWGVGVPPSGPMDALSFRLVNALVGNEPDAAGLEMALEGAALLACTQPALVWVSCSSMVEARFSLQPMPACVDYSLTALACTLDLSVPGKSQLGPHCLTGKAAAGCASDTKVKQCSAVPGPKLKVHAEVMAAVGGAAFEVLLDGKAQPLWTSFVCPAGSTLQIGKVRQLGRAKMPPRSCAAQSMSAVRRCRLSSESLSQMLFLQQAQAAEAPASTDRPGMMTCRRQLGQERAAIWPSQGAWTCLSPGKWDACIQLAANPA